MLLMLCVMWMGGVRRRGERSSRQQTTLLERGARARVEALLFQYNGAGVLIRVGGCDGGGREEQAQGRPHGWLPGPG
jgi:hypothetical protein